MSIFNQSWYRNLCGLIPATRSQREPSTGIERVRQETLAVNEFLISEFVGSSPQNGISQKILDDKVRETLKTLVTQIMEADDKRFDELAQEMDMEKLKKTPHLVVNTVLESMFEDGRIHWLRIVAAYVYAITLAKRCDSDTQKDLGASVIRAVGSYIINENIAAWIYSQGGWKTITSVFVDPNDLEQKLKSAGYLALAVGFGALLSAIVSR